MDWLFGNELHTRSTSRLRSYTFWPRFPSWSGCDDAAAVSPNRLRAQRSDRDTGAGRRLVTLPSLRAKLFAGVWLTACTYPIVVLTLPPLTGRFYLPIAETFAPVAECVLFATLVGRWKWRDMAAIVVANLASFVAGEMLFRW